MEDVLKRFWDAGVMHEATMNEKYSFEKTLAKYHQALQLRQCAVISSVDCPMWLTKNIKENVKELWNRPNNDNSNPRVMAIKLIRKTAEEHGVSIDLKMSAEIVNKHCL